VGPKGQGNQCGMDWVVPHGAGAQWDIDLAVPRGAGPGGILRGRDPGRAEQFLCRPMWWGLGGPAALLVDHGMEKPSMI
jgi:hypothetical protein